MIQSENTFLIGYVIFDKVEGIAEVDAVEQAKRIPGSVFPFPHDNCELHTFFWHNNRFCWRFFHALALRPAVVLEFFYGRGVNLSVAVWVGFIALFGISTNDGVLMGTYIHETFKKLNPQTRSEIKAAVVQAGLKRVRPAAMTTATTLIALLPVLTSTGKGSAIMVPMAIPAFGGMLIQSITMFTVPVLQCVWRERKISILK
jgi:preprotein translocase subunit SecF